MSHYSFLLPVQFSRKLDDLLECLEVIDECRESHFEAVQAKIDGLNVEKTAHGCGHERQKREAGRSRSR